MERSYVSAPILIVLSIFCFLYYTTFFVVTDQWLGLSTSRGLMNASIFKLLALMCVVTDVMAIVKYPGQVPLAYLPDMEDSETPTQEFKRKDHHCLWINNCVGHANYKVFFVFVFYTVIACIYSMALLVGSIVHGIHKDQRSRSSFRTNYVICGVLLVPITLALSILLGWHIYLILQNKTTIEG